MALLPTYVKGPKPTPPKGGGHYVPHAGGFQLIHAIGPGKWAPGAPGAKAPKGSAPKTGGNINTGIYANPIYQPSQPLSGSSEAKAAKALTDAQILGPSSELASQIASNNKQTGRSEKAISGYFNTLGGFANQGVTDQTKIANNLNAGLGLIGGAENQQLQGIGQQGQQALAQYTPGGVGQAGGQSLTAEMARQQGLAAQNQGSFKSAGALQGANMESLAASNLGSFAKSGQETLGKMGVAGQLKNEPLVAKIAGLKAQRGALYAKNLGGLRQQEIANQFTRQGLGLKNQSLQLTAAQDAARNALVARGQDVTSAGQKVTAANNLANQQIKWAQVHQTAANDAASQAAKQAALYLGWYKAQHPPGAKPPGPLSHVSNNAWFAKLGEVEGLVNKAHGNGQHDPNAIRSALETGSGTPHGILYDPVLVETAFQLLGYGSINQTQAQILHQMGLRGGTFRGTPIKVTPDYKKGSGSLFGQPFKIY